MNSQESLHELQNIKYSVKRTPISDSRIKSVVNKGSNLIRYGGIAFLIGAIQFLIGMFVTILKYGPPSYNFQRNSISDLQAIHCGLFSGNQVCSPLHTVANFSVAVVGLLLVIGTLLIRSNFPKNRRSSIAFAILIIGGLGAFANGFTPEDVTLVGDTATALVAFLGANFGLIQLGRAMSQIVEWHNVRAYTKISGAFGLVALILDGVNITGPLGSGIEWFIVAPVVLWMFVFGIQLLRMPPKTYEKTLNH